MIYALVFNKMLRKLIDKKSAMLMKSKVFKKCDPNEEFLELSHTPLPILRIRISAFGVLCKANNLLASCKNQIDYLLTVVYFIRGELCKKILVIKEFVNINKKYATKDTLHKDEHENTIQEKYDSVTSTSKESAQSHKDNEINIA